MSGPLQDLTDNSTSLSADQALIVENVRQLSGVPSVAGPDDARIFAAVREFAGQFHHWYTRVMAEAVAKYRGVIIGRINPFIRRIECDGLDTTATAGKLIEDYNARNFVTAGGWALERMAVHVSPHAKKSAAAGIDLEREDPSTGAYHLYVLKSGLVTRNADILVSLKRNVRKAEQIRRQGGQEINVQAHYAILAGKTKASFEDGINRPSSAQFWSQMTGLPERGAIDLVLAIAAEAGRMVRRDASIHINAMKTLVADYIADRGDAAAVDWEFIARRNMERMEAWKAEDQERHKRAFAVLLATGYVPEKRPAKKGKPRKRK